MWAVVVHPLAGKELAGLPAPERAAVDNAVLKLRAAGPTLGYPHSSAVVGAQLRELRPRAGRSAWRAFYARVGDVFVVVAVGSEAEHDHRAFTRAVAAGKERLADIVTQEEEGP